MFPEQAAAALRNLLNSETGPVDVGSAADVGAIDSTEVGAVGLAQPGVEAVVQSVNLLDLDL